LLLIALISLAWIPVAGRGEAPESIPIPNANFEDGTNGWELVNLGKGGTMAMDETELHNGKPTLRIESSGQLTFAQRPVKVKPHTTYLLSGYIKVKDVHQTGGAGIAGAVVMTGGQFPYGAQGTYGTTDWRQVTTQLNTDDKTEIQVGPDVGWFGCKVSGTGWFSDLSLAELEEDRESEQDGAGSNLITNGNFERDTYGWERINFGMEGTMEMDPAADRHRQTAHHLPSFRLHQGKRRPRKWRSRKRRRGVNRRIDPDQNAGHPGNGRLAGGQCRIRYRGQDRHPRGTRCRIL